MRKERRWMIMTKKKEEDKMIRRKRERIMIGRK